MKYLSCIAIATVAAAAKINADQDASLYKYLQSLSGDKGKIYKRDPETFLKNAKDSGVSFPQNFLEYWAAGSAANEEMQVSGD